MKQKILTMKDLYQQGVEILKENEITEYDLDAWYLLEFVTGISKAMYFGYPNQEVAEEKAEQYLQMIQKRSTHIPLQHLTGEQEFMGLSFLVNDQVLIPRQDTERLVEFAEKRLKPNMKIADMCTGSGCILLSLLKRNQMLKIQGTGIDISKEALKIAEENARRLDICAKFIESNLFEQVEDEFDLIVSNPPYIPTKVIETLAEEVKVHDPWIALDGKEDGLYFYRKIILESKEHLKDQGWLLFEIGHDQGESVSMLMEKAGYTEVCVKKDFAGLDRVVFGMYNKK